MSQIKRFYVVIDQGNKDIAPLTFRSEKAANQFLDENKKYKVLHRSYEYPIFKDTELTQEKLKSLLTTIEYYRPKLDEKVEFTEFENRNFARTGAIV